MTARVVEKFESWSAAGARLRQIREAGFHGQITDDAEGTVTLIVDGGKREQPLAALPARGN